MKIADALNVNIDFLVGKTSFEVNLETPKRVEDITKLSQSNRDYLFSLIDLALRDFNLRRAYA